MSWEMKSDIRCKFVSLASTNVVSISSTTIVREMNRSFIKTQKNEYLFVCNQWTAKSLKTRDKTHVRKNFRDTKNITGKLTKLPTEKQGMISKSRRRTSHTNSIFEMICALGEL